MNVFGSLAMDRDILKVLEEIREQYRTTNTLLPRLVLPRLAVDAAAAWRTEASRTKHCSTGQAEY